MNGKRLLLIFFILLLASTVSVVADEEQHHHDEETLTLDGYEIGLATEPESPEVGEEAHLVVHIDSGGESVTGLHVEIQIAKMEMHSGEMKEHMVLSFEEGHAHEEENEPGHYALHHTFEEEGTYMIQVKIEDVGVTDDAFHVTVKGSFHKGELTLYLVLIAIGIGVAALVVVGVKMRGA